MNKSCREQIRVKELMRNTQNWRIRVRLITLVISAMLILLLTACQPTPEKEVVVGKGDGLSEVIQTKPDIAGSAAPNDTSTQTNDVLYTKLSAPKHWNFEKTALNEKLNITADVAIELPGVSQLPAVTASLSEFNQEDLDRIAKVLGVGDAVWRELSFQMTKEEIEQKLIETKAFIAALKDENHPHAAHADGLIEKAKESIEQYEQLYIDAPYEIELKKIEFKIGEIAFEVDQTLIGFEGIANVDNQPFFFGAYNAYYYDRVNRVRASFDRAYFGGVNIDAPYGVSLTKEQATEQASKIAEQLTDELSLCYITPAATDRDDMSRNWGWACVFMRKINGCPTVYERAEVALNLEAVNVPVTYEKMIIVMDDMGMVSFTWDIPMTIETIDNPDVPLLSFDEISQRAIEQISQRYADTVREDILNGIDWGDPGCTANVIKVELGLMRVDKVDSSDYYYLPVWKFFVDTIHTEEFYERTGMEPKSEYDFVDEDGNPSNINGEYSLRYNVITLNALDGSTIDSGLGY